MEDREYFQWLRENNQAILAAVAHSPELPLSACPGWLARDLLTHLGGWYSGWYRYNIVRPPHTGDSEEAAASASPPPGDIEHELGLAWHPPTERAVEALDDTVTYNLLLALTWGAPLPSAPLIVEPTDASTRWIASPVDGAIVFDETSAAGGGVTLRAPVAELLLHLHGRMAWHPTPGSDPQVASEWQGLIGLW